MKFDWGVGIVLVIVVFLIGMITLVIISSSQELNLVTPDYYPKGISYQEQIEKELRSNALEDQVFINQDDDFIYVYFPRLDSVNKPGGNVLLFYPRSNRFDKNYEVAVDDSLRMQISKDSIMTGRCRVKVDWNWDTTDYYYEQEVMLR